MNAKLVNLKFRTGLASAYSDGSSTITLFGDLSDVDHVIVDQTEVSFTKVDSSTITFSAPAKAAGTVSSITVVSGTSSSTLTDAISYMAAPGGGAAPTAVSPATVVAAGGTTLTITVPNSAGLTGAKLLSTKAIYLLSSFAISDATHVTAVTPAGVLVDSVTALDLKVTNADGDSPALAASVTVSG